MKKETSDKAITELVAMAREGSRQVSGDDATFNTRAMVDQLITLKKAIGPVIGSLVASTPKAVTQEEAMVVAASVDILATGGKISQGGLLIGLLTYTYALLEEGVEVGEEAILFEQFKETQKTATKAV